jgi:phosphatidylserine/phosphatidylglycerophosphate/cardiolipin synthase-like enzyme
VGFFPVGDLAVETAYARPEPDGEDPSLLRRLVQMVDDTPAGGEICATVFRLTVDWVRDALVAARDRGVRVRVVHNGGDRREEVGLSLAEEPPAGLGEAGHRWTGPAYDPEVHDFGAVATGPSSDMHTKLFLFSATQDPQGELREHVSWWGSANLSHRSGMQRSNNAVAVYGDAVLHHAFRTRLWDLMWAGTHFPCNDFYNGRLGRGVFMASPALKCKVFCSPEQDTDLWVGRLRSVVVAEETEVHLVHSRFTDARVAVADELVRIRQEGGSVRVVVGDVPEFLGPTVRTRLLGAGIPLRTAAIHDKLGLVRSRYGASRRARKVVFSGSHNLNRDANYLNDEVLVKMFDDEVYDDMLAAHVEPIWTAARPVG